MPAGEERDGVEIRLRAREARISRVFNVVLGLLTLRWRGEEEGEPLPDGGRRIVVPRDVFWIGRIVLVLMIGAIGYALYLLWTYRGLMGR